jgi:acetylglutamate kinase
VGDVAAVNPASSSAARRGPHPGGLDDRLRRRGQAYNINADTVAGALAEALGAEKVVYLTDVAGLLADVDDPDSLISRHAAGSSRRCDDGRLTGGMIPKIARAVHAVRTASARPTCSTGRVAHVLLLELFSDAGIGTMITADAVAAAAPSDQEGPA